MGICNKTLIVRLFQSGIKLIFKWSRSEKLLGMIGKNITSVVKWTFQEDARDIVNEIAGIKSISIRQLCLCLEVPYKAVEGACAIYLMFSHF